MLDQVDNTTTIVGLLFFFSIFIGVMIYAFNPRSKKEMEEHANIPLKESDEID